MGGLSRQAAALLVINGATLGGKPRLQWKTIRDGSASLSSSSRRIAAPCSPGKTLTVPV